MEGRPTSLSVPEPPPSVPAPPCDQQGSVARNMFTSVGNINVREHNLIAEVNYGRFMRIWMSQYEGGISFDG